VIVGDGATRYAEVFRERFPDAALIDAPRPLAEAAAALAAARADQAGAPHALRAVYLRRPDVEIARERVGVASKGESAVGWSVRRAATAADLEAVEQLQQKTFTNPWNADSIRWELENTDVARLYLLQDPDGQTVAYCACWVVFDELHINSLAVDPAWRRRGVARHLLRRVMADASASGATSATLEVRSSNEAARQLYEGLAFRVEGVRRDYYRDPREDALILWNRRLT
jgi:ribosomal-protein-alanine N-acetyltransferase